eukprot:TRINITY_DN12033_c0_g2_i1.p1 TRINITY_DN12033_c0_g2~~TRINITY_DN12033_c0_g2_i1.p1  ORF type:complete len:374 (+),score=49.04 TRINITY_DN12033_c0_g2_i1:375-1496(+)
MEQFAKALVWGLLVICSFRCILGQQQYYNGPYRRGSYGDNNNNNNNAAAYVSSSASSSSSSTSTSSGPSSYAFSQAFSQAPMTSNFQSSQSIPTWTSAQWALPGGLNLNMVGSQQSPPPPPPSPPTPTQSSDSEVVQVKPQDCSVGHRVICVENGGHPCDGALENTRLSNVLCIQYTCKDKLKVGEVLRDDLMCRAVFYDPNTHYAVDPLQHVKEQDPCQKCQQNSVSNPAKKVCCGGTEFDNMCLARCQNLDVHCSQGPCKSNIVTSSSCVGDCFSPSQGIFETDQYCCENSVYTNECTASCFYEQGEFYNKCYKKFEDTCQGNNVIVETAELPSQSPPVVEDAQKAINFDDLILNLQELTIGSTSFSTGGK